MSNWNSRERVAQRRGASAALTMDPIRALLGVLLGISRGTDRPGPAVTTFWSRAFGAIAFMTGLAAILAVTLARS